MKKLTPKTSRHVLDEVKKGDEIEDNTGKRGEVTDIEIIHYNKESHYYYKIREDGTILIIS